jgi:hypothetical protein
MGSSRAFALVCLLAGCNLVGCGEPRSTPNVPPATSVVRTPSEPPGFTSVRIDGVPHVKQKPDFCGEAVAASYLQKLGKPYEQDDVFNLSGMDPARGMGATTRELKVALERIGFDVGPVWHQVPADDPLDALFADLYADLAQGVPSIVCTHYDDSLGTTEHFRLVLGYDAATDEVIYHEPAEADGGYRRMKRDEMLALWPLKYASDAWTVVRFRLAPGELQDPPARRGKTDADYAQYILGLKRRLPDGFSIVLERPFVVAGDESQAVVAGRAQSTVRWAVDKLKAAYFSRDPKRILGVFLFKDEGSYRHHAKELFDDEPDTPYGYYSHEDRALVMNIATGGGTLVHEIVHPFVEANFPDCPAWFNEGLGSLYEQSAERNGDIVGLTNWRLPGLQRAIKKKRVPSFEELTATSDGAFYDEDPGTNYAQARYLLYYLQEQGLLRRYYREFHARRKEDPTGYQTLKTVLGESDMDAFKKRWESYVLTLEFR